MTLVIFLLDGAVGAVCGLISGPGASSVASGAGGQKQMIGLGVDTVTRTLDELAQNGYQAFKTEAKKAAKYYLKSTAKVTNNLVGKASGRVWAAIGIGNGYNAIKAMVD